MDEFQQEQMRRQAAAAAAAASSQSSYGASLFSNPQAQSMPFPTPPPPGVGMYPNDVFPSMEGASHAHPYFSHVPPPFDDVSNGGKRHAPSGRWRTPPTVYYPKSKKNTDPVTADAFADGTQGLVLDKAVLSKVLARDEADISDEHIRSIMVNKDLLNIYKKLQEEEIKRQKRLDNNRKTAQMRRKKKKGLVETYEAQVSELENILAKIRAHKFGQGDVDTLTEALSGEQRQSVNMTKDAKHQETSVLLKQHSRNASAVRQANEDNWMLTLAASNDPMFVELKHILGLTEMQCMRLSQLQHHIHNESTRLAIVEKCFAALHVHEWLHFPHTETLVDLFRAPLSDLQLQKFVQWTRVNQPIIQQLEFAGGATNDDKDLEFEFPSEL
ncbi:hypothetical protein AC1031_011248 [Aphanomyces cochlioides]|nr:hypothetical protein AC1031_011248 [Aphanomyces cochlioides]